MLKPKYKSEKLVFQKENQLLYVKELSLLMLYLHTTAPFRPAQTSCLNSNGPLLTSIPYINLKYRNK